MTNIEFIDQENRVYGLVILLESHINFDGIGRNMFWVQKEHLELFDKEGIKYKILDS